MYSDTRWVQVSTSWHPGSVLATRSPYRCALIQGECRWVPPDIPGVCWPQEDSTDVLWYKVNAGEYLLTSQECAGFRKTLQMYSHTRWVQVSTSWHHRSVLASRRPYRCTLIQGECRWVPPDIPGVCWPQEGPTDVLWYKVNVGGVPPDIPGVCWPREGPTGVLWYKGSAG